MGLLTEARKSQYAKRRTSARSTFGLNATTTPTCPALRDEYANGRIGEDLEHTLRAHRATIRLPANPAHRPDRDRLAWHAGVVYRG